MRRMTYLLASSKFGGDGNLNKPNLTSYGRMVENNQEIKEMGSKEGQNVTGLS